MRLSPTHNSLVCPPLLLVKSCKISVNVEVPLLLGQMLLSRIYYSFLRQDLQDFQDSMNYLLLQISFLFLKNLSWNTNLNLFCLLNFFFCYLQILDYQNFLYFLYYPYHPIRLLSFVFVLFWFHLLPQNY